MKAALATHDEIVQVRIEAHGGVVFSKSGDGVASVFARADDAVGAALDLQRRLSSAEWPAATKLEVRMGLHTGESEERDDDYLGPAVNRAARVADAANGSQILVSGTTADIVAHELPTNASLVDLGDHHLRDIPGSVRLFRLELPELTRDRRPPRTGTALAGNLPIVADPLLGRAAEVEQTIEDLRSAQIVTLTGVGGIGKTRLAIEVGHRLRSGQRDGVWLARLDQVKRPGALLQALLGMLGIEARAAHSELEALTDSLRFRRALLVLDNCEHLLDPAAEVASRIASSCPNIEVLATSREVLDVAGERVRRVHPLGLDDDGAAVELFFLRAEASGARLDRSKDAPLVREICRRLDGIPLAIELAAARARSLRPAQILERLDDMFRLLTAGRRQGIERHRTLRATLDWSYGMLSDRERAVLNRLAVFAGSFSLDAAESITGGDLLERDEFIDVIDQLVARSVVVPAEEIGESRFQLLEPVRQFAAEQLLERGESDRVREAHGRFYSDLMVDLNERWRSGDDQGTWPVAARELANLRVAFDWLIETERIDDAQRFAAGGLGPIVLHFDDSPQYDWAPRAVSLDVGHVGPWTASACAVAAWGAMSRGDSEGAMSCIRLGEAAASKGSIDEGLLVAADRHHVLFGGEQALSDDFLEYSTDAAVATGDLHRQVWVLTYRGRGDEALAAAEQLGNQVLVLLARTAVWPDDEQARWELLEESWEIAQRSHSFIMRNMAAHRLGAFHVRHGTPLDGLLLLRTPARDWLLHGDTRVWDVLYSIAAGFVALGDLETADRLHDAIPDRRTALSRRDRDLLEGSLDGFKRSGPTPSTLDAGAAVALALDRIEAIASEAEQGAAHPDAETAELTARQHEVTKLVARGFSNKAIAARLGVSRYTVETHVRNILDRLDATSRTEIVAWFMRQGAT